MPFPNGENRKLAGRRPCILYPEVRLDEVLEIGTPVLDVDVDSSKAGDWGVEPVPRPLDLVREMTGSCCICVRGDIP